MKIEVENLIKIKDKEVGIIFIPTIMLDKNRYSTYLYIAWLCFNITITLKEYYYENRN